MSGPLRDETRRELLRIVPEDIAARRFQRHTGGRWVIWYGHATGRFWAMPRPPNPWRGLVEAATLESLAARLTEIDTFHGLRPAIRRRT